MTTETDTAPDEVQIICPKCDAYLGLPIGSPTQCPRCAIELEAHRFDPAPIRDEQATVAMPEDATCAHHPDKQAVDICAGSGDYICRLCSVEIGGETYSAHYLDAGGQKKLTQAFDRRLPRPDRAAVLCLMACFLFSIGAPLLVPLAFYNYYRMFRLRATVPLYREMVGPGRVAALTLVMLVITGFAIFVFGLIVSA